MECTKRGKSKILKEISTDIMEQLKDITYKNSTIECVLSHLKKYIEIIDNKPKDYFYLRGRFNEGKDGLQNKFIDRMKDLEKQDPELYQLPESGEYYEYAIVKPFDIYKANGCHLKSRYNGTS